MIETTYRDLAEFGLAFIAPGEPTFDLRFEEMRSFPAPFGPDFDCTPDRAAVLENQSGSAVITWGYEWRYIDAGGETRTSSRLDLGSGRQMDVLTGRAKATRELFSFILPGSRRLITEDGVFGDNRDVLGSPPATGGGWGFSRVRRTNGRGVIESDFGRTIVRVELEIDVAIFEDGLCVGADESDGTDTTAKRYRRRNRADAARWGNNGPNLRNASAAGAAHAWAALGPA